MLKADVDKKDEHSSKINDQKATFKSLAIEWHINGKITDEQKDEIIYMADNSPFDYWRPLVYVIPRPPVESRMQLVPINKRAGFGNEYIIPDLNRHEFDLIEL